MISIQNTLPENKLYTRFITQFGIDDKIQRNVIVLKKQQMSLTLRSHFFSLSKFPTFPVLSPVSYYEYGYFLRISVGRTYFESHQKRFLFVTVKNLSNYKLFLNVFKHKNFLHIFCSFGFISPIFSDFFFQNSKLLSDLKN